MTEQSGGPSIIVDVTTLASLGEFMLDQAEGMRINAAGVLFTMNDHVTNFAGGGLAEGATFQKVHDKAHAHLTQFLNDVVNGLTVLGNAAVEISAAYGEADAYSAATVNDVHANLPGSDDGR